jgi:mono/diheme cytochrome c family protein
VKGRQFIAATSLILLGILITTACASGALGELDPKTSSHADGMQEMMDEHMPGGKMPGDAQEHSAADHMTGPHAIPEAAAAVPNPIPFSEDSVAAGEAIYAAKCSVCHGENGRGDGPTAASLTMSPADLHEGHVQDLTDGALFFIITNGRSGTPMAAWEEILSERERWNVVNFLRTFRE